MARWFRFRTREIGPDPILGQVQQGVIAALAALGGRLTQLELFAKTIDEHATDARKLEKRLAGCETLSHSTRELLVDQIARVDQTIQQLRGTATGGMRGRRSAATDIGEILISAVGSAEQAHQLALQLADHAHQNGNGSNGHGGSAIEGDVPSSMRRA